MEGRNEGRKKPIDQQTGQSDRHHVDPLQIAGSAGNDELEAQKLAVCPPTDAAPLSSEPCAELAPCKEPLPWMTEMWPKLTRCKSGGWKWD